MLNKIADILSFEFQDVAGQGEGDMMNESYGRKNAKIKKISKQTALE